MPSWSGASSESGADPYYGATGAAPPVRAAICAGGPLEEFVWLAGAWTSRGPGRITEERWLAPCGMRMVGVNRSVDASGRESFEFLRLEAMGDAVVYAATPMGGLETDFRLIQSGPDIAVFANDNHDYPKRIQYFRSGDTLTATLSGYSDQPVETWTFTRTAAPG